MFMKKILALFSFLFIMVSCVEEPKKIDIKLFEPENELYYATTIAYDDTLDYIKIEIPLNFDQKVEKIDNLVFYDQNDNPIAYEKTEMLSGYSLCYGYYQHRIVVYIKNDGLDFSNISLKRMDFSLNDFEYSFDLDVNFILNDSTAPNMIYMYNSDVCRIDDKIYCFFVIKFNDQQHYKILDFTTDSSFYKIKNVGYLIKNNSGASMYGEDYYYDYLPFDDELKTEGPLVDHFQFKIEIEFVEEPAFFSVDIVANCMINNEKYFKLRIDYQRYEDILHLEPPQFE